MRAQIFAAFLAFSAPAAVAQTDTPQRPTTPAPAESASVEARQDWCAAYVAWFVSRMPEQRNLPQDAREGHLTEVEYQFCVLDPQDYQRQSLAELERVNETG